MKEDRKIRPAARYRVVLVTLPEGGPRALQQALPGHHLPRPDSLPAVVRVTTSHEAAREAAERLVAAGAGALVLEELGERRVVCEQHPPQLIRGSCRSCGAPVCAACILEAEGERLCGICGAKHRNQDHRIKTRQLFVVFLFAVFLYQVYRFYKADKVLRRAGRPIPVALLQFVPPGALHHPLVRGLSDLLPSDDEGLSYADVASFFDKERQRYTGHSSPAIHLSVRGPWMERPSPPSPDEGDSLLSAVWSSLRYARYWRRLGESHGVSHRRYPIRLFVVFTEEGGDQAAYSRADEGGRLAITYISLEETNPTYAVLTMIHELAHALGASDKYDEWGHAVYPEGYVEPYREDIYPQRYAEIMAGDIPYGPREEREAESLDQLRIGYATAAEIGWISEDVAEAFFRAPAITPDQKLPSDEDGEDGEDPDLPAG